VLTAATSSHSLVFKLSHQLQFSAKVDVAATSILEKPSNLKYILNTVKPVYVGHPWLHSGPSNLYRWPTYGNLWIQNMSLLMWYVTWTRILIAWRRNITLYIIHTIFKTLLLEIQQKVKVKSSRYRPGVAQRVRLPDLHDIRHMKVVRSLASRTGRLYPRECSWYSFSLGAESTPGPWCGRKEICHWKFQWHHRKSIPGPSD
jgi:hypothetical protein